MTIITNIFWWSKICLIRKCHLERKKHMTINEFPSSHLLLPDGRFKHKFLLNKSRNKHGNVNERVSFADFSFSLIQNMNLAFWHKNPMIEMDIEYLRFSFVIQ